MPARMLRDIPYAKHFILKMSTIVTCSFLCNLSVPCRFLECCQYRPWLSMFIVLSSTFLLVKTGRWLFFFSEKNVFKKGNFYRDYLGVEFIFFLKTVLFLLTLLHVADIFAFSVIATDNYYHHRKKSTKIFVLN